MLPSLHSISGNTHTICDLADYASQAHAQMLVSYDGTRSRCCSRCVHSMCLSSQQLTSPLASALPYSQQCASQSHSSIPSWRCTVKSVAVHSILYNYSIKM